jgi:hypothetical protein
MYTEQNYPTKITTQGHARRPYIAIFIHLKFLLTIEVQDVTYGR